MKDSIHSYIRDEKRNPVGVVAAVKEPNGRGVAIGYSLCHPTKEKRFDKAEGVRLAVKRARLYHTDYVWSTPVKHADLVNKALHDLALRAWKYFKIN